jgi:hypothetical protein
LVVPAQHPAPFFPPVSAHVVGTLDPPPHAVAQEVFTHSAKAVYAALFPHDWGAFAPSDTHVAQALSFAQLPPVVQHVVFRQSLQAATVLEKPHDAPPESGVVVVPVSGGLVLPVSGKLVLPVSGKLVEPVSGMLVLPLSGRCVVPASAVGAIPASGEPTNTMPPPS